MEEKPFNQVEVNTTCPKKNLKNNAIPLFIMLFNGTMQVTQLELAPTEDEQNHFTELELQEETQENNPQQRESQVP